MYDSSVNCPLNTAVFAAVRCQFGTESQLTVDPRPQQLQLAMSTVRRLEHCAALQRLQSIPHRGGTDPPRCLRTWWEWCCTAVVCLTDDCVLTYCFVDAVLRRLKIHETYMPNNTPIVALVFSSAVSKYPYLLTYLIQLFPIHFKSNLSSRFS